jgi:hypothetical protein
MIGRQTLVYTSIALRSFFKRWTPAIRWSTSVLASNDVSISTLAKVRILFKLCSK